jgi:hypothetical protein
MSDDVESNQYDIGTTSIRLSRVGNLIHILFSNKFEARILYQELVEKYKRAEEQYRGG